MRIRLFAATLIMGVLLTAPGCLTPSELQPVRRYVLEPELDASALAQSNVIAPTVTLGIRPLTVARPYTTQIAFRDKDLSLGYYDSAQWAESPSPVVTRTLEDALRLTTVLADVGDAANMARPDLILTGEVRKYYEDRTTEPRQAVLEISLDLRRAQQVESLLMRTFSVGVPMQSDDVTGFALAMNEALARLAHEAAPAIAKAATDPAGVSL